MDKNRLKSVIFGYEMRITAIISNGLVHRATKRTTLQILKNELVKFQKRVKLSDSEKHELWNRSLFLYNKISKKSFSLLRKALNVEKTDKDYDKVLEMRKTVVYESFRKEFKTLELEKNSLANEVEHRAKAENFKDLTSSGVFFLASSHVKPAKDHADWEGKIYVSEFWKDRVDDNQDRARIEAYIRNHDIKTVEWVTGEPVYLIFRPNCKHYLIPLDIEEVLHNSARALLKKHSGYMYHTHEMTYEEGQYRLYYERLKTLRYLQTMFDCEKLREDIAKTRKLTVQWYDRARQNAK